MLQSIKKSKLSRLLLGISVLSVLGFAPYFMGPGLNTPEPIGPYLNNAFPGAITSTGDLYQPVFPNLTFESPLTFNEVSGDRIIIGQRDGQIFWFDKTPDVTQKTTILDLTDQVGVVWDGGFLGLAVHPEFGTTGKNFIYTWYSSEDQNGNDFPDFPGQQSCYNSADNGNFMYLTRFELNPIDLTYVNGSQTTMIKVDMYGTTHRGGGMDFGDDGFLYLSTGDQARWSQSQDIENNLHGGVLRIDVDKDPTKSHPPIRTMPQDVGNPDEATGLEYWIPNDNPFLSPTGDLFEEYFTLGNRNPHRMTKDRETGIFYIGEIGGNQHEEINVVSAGKNYGWPAFEGNGAGPGTCAIPLYNNMAHEGPLVEFPRAEANSITGGYVYRGSEIPELYGRYLCADYGNGEEIWSVDINTGAYEQLGVFASSDIISFGEDVQGELYLMKLGVSTLFKITSPTNVDLTNVPQLLSQTGAFQDVATLTPNPGIIPYDLVESFWSDGAEKQRWMVIPNDGTHDTPEEQISFSENEDWVFPEGAVLIKHFELPTNENNPNETRRLETRFSIKGSDGKFYFLTYKWNEDQTDAVLLEGNLEEDIPVTQLDGSTENQTWYYPNMVDCFSCHNQATGGSIGPRTRNLNSEMLYPTTSLTANQLVTLSHLGILNEPIDDNTVQNYLTHKSIDDTNATLDERARSYLDLNCAYCHRPGGSGDRAQFDLRLFNNLVETGLMYAGTNTPLGIPGEKIVVGGDANRSILYHRMASIDPNIAMPPIGKNVVDQQGVDLIEAWINQLDPDYEDPTIYESIYTITNVGSGLVMEVAGSSQDNLADIQQWQDSAAPNQQFIVAPAEDDYFTFEAVHSNKKVDVQGQGQAPGTNVIQYQDNGTDAQLFTIKYLGNEEYAIISKANGLYLGIENNSLVNGGSVKTYNDDGSDFFKWTFLDLLYEPVTGVDLFAESSTIFVGENIQLSASVIPNNASNQDVFYITSDETVATVDASGNVSGVSEGTAIITVTTCEGEFTDDVVITVISYDNCNSQIVDHTDPVGTGTIVARAEINEAENRFKAFDNKKTQGDFSKWLDNAGVPSEVDPSFISIEFDDPKWVNNIVITSANDDFGRDPENFRLLGSNGGSFVELGSWTGVQFSNRYQSKSFAFVNDTAYEVYRLEITKNDEDVALTQLAEIELLGCDVIPGITYVYDNGWSPSDPISTANPNDKLIIETGDALVSGDTECSSLTVEAGASISIDPGVTFTTISTTLKSTSQLYSSLILDGTIEGTINYERYVNANSGGNDLVSPPLSGQTWSDFLLSGSNVTDLLNDGNVNPTTYLFGPFDKTADSYINYNDNTAANLISGTGYRAATITGAPLTFTGSVPTTTIPVNILYSGTSFQEWNLIGNPFPSYISIANFLNHEIASGVRNIDILEDISGIYGYDGDASNGWDVITLANAGSRLMAPGQGFFVAADPTDVVDYDIIFDASMRRVGSDDDFIAGRSANELTYLRLKASTSTDSYLTDFYFNDNASLGLDIGYDGKILGNSVPNFAIYSHLIEDNTGLPIALQALNPADLSAVIIPLGVNASQGEEITFSVEEISLPSDTEVYLEDTEENTLTLLNSTDYVLVPATDLNGTGRFYLRFTSETLSDSVSEIDEIKIFANTNKELVVKGELLANSTLILYDIQGKIVLDSVLNPFNRENTVDVSMLETGVYIVKVFNNKQSRTQKVIIR